MVEQIPLQPWKTTLTTIYKLQKIIRYKSVGRSENYNYLLFSHYFSMALSFSFKHEIVRIKPFWIFHKNVSGNHSQSFVAKLCIGVARYVKEKNAEEICFREAMTLVIKEICGTDRVAPKMNDDAWLEITNIQTSVFAREKGMSEFVRLNRLAKQVNLRV